MKLSTTPLLSGRSVLVLGLVLPLQGATLLEFEQASDFTSHFSPTSGPFGHSATGGFGGSGGLVRNPTDGSTTIFTYTSETMDGLGPGKTVQVGFDFQISGPDTGAIGVVMRGGIKPASQPDDALNGNIGANGGLYITGIAGGLIDYTTFSQSGGLSSRVYGSTDGTLQDSASPWLHYNLLIQGLANDEILVTTHVSSADSAVASSAMTGTIQNGAPYVFGLSMNDSIIALDNFSFVPEPSAAMLGIPGLAMVLGRRRRGREHR